MGNFYSLITVLKCICADFKGLPNGANFILIDHCVGELLSINKVSSERERTIGECQGSHTTGIQNSPTFNLYLNNGSCGHWALFMHKPNPSKQTLVTYTSWHLAQQIWLPTYLLTHPTNLDRHCNDKGSHQCLLVHCIFTSCAICRYTHLLLLILFHECT